MRQNDDYKNYLISLHSKRDTPEEIARNVVKEGVGKEPISKRKIVAGEVNEVYEITLSDSSKVILRISPNGSPDFKQEEWAMKKAEELGVPVPKILLIKYLTMRNKEYGFCLMKKINGELLERGKIDFNKLSRDQQQRYLNQAGEILSKIHSIPMIGFGRIVGKGKSRYKNTSQLFANWLDKRDLYEKTAREAVLDLSIVKTAFKLGEDFKEKLLQIQPHLNHGDYFPKHLMVKGGKIIGILDWADIRSDSSVYDFANWDFWVGKHFPTKWLKEGYTNKSLFDDDFEAILHFVKITIGLEVFEWYHKQKYKERVEKTKAKLAQDINYFK